MEARIRALQEQHEKEQLATRPHELAKQLTQLEAEQEKLLGDLDAARAANGRARADAEAAAGKARREAEEAEASRTERQQQVFEAARQQRVNDAR
jgi:hypothetical protein